VTARIVAVDIGGSGSRVRLVGPGVRREVQARRVRSIGVRGIDVAALVNALNAAVAQLRAQCGAGEVDGIGIGIRGLLRLADDVSGLRDELSRWLGARVIVLASDAVTAHVGALGLEPGAVVAAGTGVVALGTDLERRWKLVDGWGHLLGDCGGGAWVGGAGLRAALRACDGRLGGSRALLDRLVARYGPPERLPRLVYPHPDHAQRMAAFATDVAAAARDGDLVAARIWEHAGHHLAETAAAALVDALPPTVSWSGGLFSAGELLTGPFRQALTRLRPDAVIAPSIGGSLDGAETLARTALDDPERLRAAAPYVRLLERG
jgi:N-acetylglucosamine kinase-like BadF-type ATPase